jgi:hypothetical protein
MTTVGVRFKDEHLSEKMLPCMTACPMNAFKSPGFHFTNETFYNQTYKIDEIFFESKKLNFSVTSVYGVDEVKSIIFGRCYTVCESKKMPKKRGLTFLFWKFRDIKGL